MADALLHKPDSIYANMFITIYANACTGMIIFAQRNRHRENLKANEFMFHQQILSAKFSALFLNHIILII